MIDSNIFSSEVYLKNAQDLFIPIRSKICSSKLTRLQSLIILARELIFFIPKSIRRKSFIREFKIKINLISAVEDDFQDKSLNNQNFALDSCVKRLKQLNSLCKIHLLIKSYYGCKSKNKTECLITDLIVRNHVLINEYINKTEDKKNGSQHAKQIESSPKSHTIDIEDKDNDKTKGLIAKPIQSYLKSVENEENEVILKSTSEREKLKGSITSEAQLIESLRIDHLKLTEDDSLILADKQTKIVGIGSSVELSQRSADAQSLQPSLINANNHYIQIGIHDSNANVSKPNNTDGLWGRVKKWTGVKGLQTGVENVRSGNYVRGFCEIAFGSIRIALTAYVTLFVAQQIMGVFISSEIPHNPLDDKHDGLGGETVYVDPYRDRFSPDFEIPRVERSQIQSESFNSAIGSRKVTLITAYDEGIKDYAQYVIPNQRTFCAKNGYDYIEYYGNLAHDQGHQRAPYWSKIVAINDQLQKGKEGDWIAWGDASVLFTNSKKNFDQIIEKYGSDKDIILTTDPQVPINNAVFLVKNTPWTKNWIKKVWERFDLAKGGEGNCWSWGQPFCHYEQQAMTELWQRDPEVQSHTVVIPNKEMNAFYRYSHYDRYRDMHQNYDGDPENSKWTPGDFICKVTGMDRDRRLGIIQHVANNCIDQDCDRIQV